MYQPSKASMFSFFSVTCLLSLLMLALAGCASNGSVSNPPGIGPASPTSTSSGSVSSSPTAQVTLGPKKPTVPFTVLRMLDQQNGWALTASSIVKTTDGGQIWKDVTPAAANITSQSTAVFYNSHTAWVSTTSPGGGDGSMTAKLIHTTDGGATWTQQTAKINSQVVGIIDIKFINRYEGWMEIGEGVGAGSEAASIVHTIDGGSTWKLISSSDYNAPAGIGKFFPGGLKTGLCFINSLTGWATATTYATNHTTAYVTHDGGVSWTPKDLPPPNTSKDVMGGSTPPVFFGQDAVLPALENNGFNFYLSHDGGSTWMTTTLVLPSNQSTSVQQNSIYVTDPTHAWAIDSQGLLYITTNGGKIWSTPLTLNNVSKFSFISNTTGWAYSGQSDKAPTLLKTTDGGSTWSKITYSIY